MKPRFSDEELAAWPDSMLSKDERENYAYTMREAMHAAHLGQRNPYRRCDSCGVWVRKRGYRRHFKRCSAAREQAIAAGIDINHG